MTVHREALKAELGKIQLTNVSVVDWGAGSKPVQRYIQSEGCTFFTIDKNGYNEQSLVTDITAPLILDQEYDVAFCIEVIEHVESFDMLLRNIRMNLKPDGKLYLSAPFQFEIHAEEDYWRFTEHGLRLLLGNFDFAVARIVPIDNLSGYFVEATKQ